MLLVHACTRLDIRHDRSAQSFLRRGMLAPATVSNSHSNIARMTDLDSSLRWAFPTTGEGGIGHEHQPSRTTSRFVVVDHRSTSVLKSDRRIAQGCGHVGTYS